MNTKEAIQIVGGLSSPSKMPCHGYSIPATTCVTGQKLAKTKGTVCSQCYAMKGFYRMQNVQSALERRFESLSHPDWIEAMVIVIGDGEKSGYFRWHDSGDLQSLGHLEAICEIADKLPEIKFWLPTREYSIVSEYVAKNGEFPSNLTVRLSALKINATPPTSVANRLGVQTSSVSDSESGFSCPSSRQGNKCLNCRSCWDKNTPNVTYRLH